jgi:hypothetical protein
MLAHPSGGTLRRAFSQQVDHLVPIQVEEDRPEGACAPKREVINAKDGHVP